MPPNPGVSTVPAEIINTLIKEKILARITQNTSRGLDSFILTEGDANSLTTFFFS